MINLNWMDMKITFQEIKEDLMRDYMLRRYSKLAVGQLPIEEQIADFLSRSSIYMITYWRLFLKRMLDVVVSLSALILGMPVWLAVVAAIRLTSKGPVIYSQQRVGMRGKTFNMFKFRSMYDGAEVKTGPVWAKEDDPRVTPVGKFLRKSHLDEVPQLINVLKGEMSIVGPRPERPYFVSLLRKEIPHYDRRHYAKPGITGLAQIKRRYDETIADVRKKVRYDVLYIKKMCPLLDLKVLALTVLAVVFKMGR